MGSRFGILVCETLRSEVVQALAAEGLDEVETAAFPCDCGHPRSPQESFQDLLQAESARFGHLFLLGGPCLNLAGRPVMAAGLDNVTCIERCFDLFLPTPLIEHFLSAGAFLLTPGWIATWPERMERWGFDQPTGRAFFSESCSRLVLLDTGTDPRGADRLAAFAAYVDRPFEVVPVGLDQLRLVLSKHILERAGNPQAPERPPEDSMEVQLANYAMVFDMMGRLVGFESEELVARAVFDLFDMICAPRLLAYLPFKDGRPGTLLTSPPAAALPDGMAETMSGFRGSEGWLEAGNGFVVRLQRGREGLGVLLVEDVALPLNKAHYLNLTLAILPVLALAVSSARNREQLESSRAELREREERLSVTLHSIGDGVIATDAGGRITRMNPAAEALTGWKWPDVLHRPLLEVFHIIHADTREPASNPVERTLATGETLGLADHTLLLARDGAEYQIADSCAPIRDAAGKIIGAVLIFRDVTREHADARERRVLEAQNQQLQKTESLGRMAGAIAHHFNNLLLAVSGNLELALDDLGEGTPARRSVDAAMEASRRAAEISTLMLTYLGQSIAQRGPTDLAALCLRNLPLLQASLPRGTVLETDLPAPGPVIHASATQMQQVLANLAANAWEACGERGGVRIAVHTASPADDGAPHRFPVDWQPEARPHACLEVADTGAGIPESDVAKIFDPFFTTKFTGRGLGLPVVLGIVRAHDGGLTVESAPGRGSTFRVYLPLAAAPGTPSPEPPAWIPSPIS